MASYTSSARFILQVTGSNNNIWGNLINTGAIQLVDDNVNGRLAFSLSGSKTLISANGITDEARNAILDVTSGTGGMIVIPSVSKHYFVRNGSSGLVTVSTGGTVNATVQPGELVSVMCDASAVRRAVPTDFAGSTLTSAGNPVNPQDVATKAYADALAFTANAGILPGQGPGTIGWALFSNGTNALWKQVATTDLSDLATFKASQLALAIAMAIAL